MAEVNVWQGGVRIVTQDSVDANSKVDTSSGQEKFDTCKHRSDKEVERVRRTCCSSTRTIGWECRLKKIAKLTPETCASCTVYEKRT